jgi:competence protein ComEA
MPLRATTQFRRQLRSAVGVAILSRMQPNRLIASAPLQLLVGAVAAAAAVLGSYLFAIQQNDGDVVIVSNPASVEIAVEIRGEVAKPGVYRLPEDARFFDLLSAAGGAGESADLSSHNLARRLVDAEIVMIQPVSSASPVPDHIRAGEDAGSGSIAYRVNVNTASQAELEALPGIGPVIAQRIINYRLANGPFQTESDLANVEGVSTALLADIQSLITFGP